MNDTRAIKVVILLGLLVAFIWALTGIPRLGPIVEIIGLLIVLLTFNRCA